MSAQRYCKNIGGNLPVLRQWEYLYHINAIAKPWPVYIGVTQVNLMSVFTGPGSTFILTLCFFPNTDIFRNQTIGIVLNCMELLHQ